MLDKVLQEISIIACDLDDARIWTEAKASDYVVDILLGMLKP